MSELKETVTVTRKVSRTIEDLVGFARYLANEYACDPVEDMTDQTIIDHANAYWSRQHGDCDDE